MSFDLHAHDAKCAKPIFHATGWAWRPIWAYCMDCYPQITDRAHPIYKDAGFYNGEARLSASDATALGQAILLDLAAGRVADYAEVRKKLIAELPKEVCQICSGTGIRTDAIGISNGWHDKAVPPDVAVQVGRDFGSCNACNGLGLLAHPLNSYPFNPEHLEAFANFALQSGGFTIK